MTILNGMHTIQDVEDLMKTVEFRLQAGLKTNAQITMDRIAGNVDLYKDLQADLNAFQVRWATARDDTMLKLFLRNNENLLVPQNLIAAEPEWTAIRKAINVGGGDTYVKGDLFDVLTRIETMAGQKINEKDAPKPSNFDPDLLAYKDFDAKVKAAEEQAKAAKANALGAAGQAASATPWWVYAGLGTLAFGVGYVYVKPLLPTPKPKFKMIEGTRKDGVYSFKE